MAPGRQQAELGLPGLTVGVVAGAMAGGLTLLAGQPTGAAALSALMLALPLGLFGGLYGMLLGHGPFRPGVFAPTGLYWLVAFPLSRLLQEAVAGSSGMSDGVLAFLAYQAMVSLGFAIGFLWMHERIMPHWLMRLNGHNPQARELFAHYVRQAEMVRTRTSKGGR